MAPEPPPYFCEGRTTCQPRTETADGQVAVRRFEQDSEQQHQLLQSGVVSDMDAVTPLPAVVSHLLFDPTLLSSTGRRRFTLRNGTTGDLPVRWDMSEVLPQTEKRHQQRPKGSGRGFSPAQAAAADSPVVPTFSSATAIAAGEAMVIPAGAAPSGGSSGRNHGAGTEGSRRVSRQEEIGTTTGATTAPRDVERRVDKRTRADLSPPSQTLADSSPSPSSSVVGTTVVLPLPADERATAAAGRAPDAGPFGIFPEFAVVPAHGEFTFEAAFSPAGLGESR